MSDADGMGEPVAAVEPVPAGTAATAESSPEQQQPTPTPAEALPWTALDDSGTPTVADQVTPGVVARGHIEWAQAGRVRGWATVVVDGIDRPLPDVRVITAGGDVVGQGVAGDFRQDVADVGAGSGWCGFDLPVGEVTPESTLALEVDAGDGWLTVSEHVTLRSEVPATLAPPSVLASFAEAGLSSGQVGGRGLRVGRGLWLVGGDDVRDRVTARLDVVAGPEAGERVPVLRVVADTGTAGRLDVRFLLAEHRPSIRAGWVALRVLNRSSSPQPARINVRHHAGRGGVGDFVLDPGRWSTLRVQVPAHSCDQADRAVGEDDGLWLELVLDASGCVDVQAPEVVAPPTADAFECVNVELQRQVLYGAPDPDLPRPSPFSVVIPFFGNAAYTAACVLSVLSCSWAPVEVIVVDDGSPHTSSVDRLLAGVRSTGRVRLVRAGTNAGYTASVNVGVSTAQHPVVVILNNDTRVTPGWDAPLRAALEDSSVFAAGPLSNAASYQSIPALRDDQGWAVNKLPVGVTPAAFAAGLRAQYSHRTLPLSVLNGFCYAVRRQSFLDLGGLDAEAFPQGYGEEVDLMLRAKAKGYECVVAPASFVYHYKSKTFGERRAELSKTGGEVIRRRWGRALDAAVRQMDDHREFDDVRAETGGMLATLAEAARG